MSPVEMPALRCEIAFSTGANLGAWQLNIAALPVALAPASIDTYTDVSADVRRLQVSRGKSRELDQYQAGRAVLTLDDRDRYYNPYFPVSGPGPYGPGGLTLVRPGRRVRCFATDPTTAVEHQLYQGVVRDWAFDFTGKFDAVARASAADAFTDIANAKVSVTTSAAAAGTAMGEVLAAAGVANRDLDAGNSTLQAMTFTASALAAARVIEVTEQGALYAETDGIVRFIQRHAFITETRHNTSQATFGAGNLSIHALDIGYESDVVKNKVAVTRTGGAEQESSDADSIAEYGEKALTLTGLASASDAEALSLARFIVGKTASPALRIKSITLKPQVHGDLMTQALTRRLLDRVTVQFTPVGGASALSQELLITGIDHDFSAQGGMTTVLTFAPVDLVSGWRLGVGELGDTAGVTATALTY